MKCYVCGKIYEDKVCPRCKFPAVQIPNTTWEEGRQALASTIEPARAAFLNTIRISMIAYHHRDENGVYVLDREEEILLGSGPELLGKELWLDREFARMGEQKTVSIRLRIAIGEKKREEQIELPNPQAPELQKIGIAMDEQFFLRLKLTNASSETTVSEPVEL